MIRAAQVTEQRRHTRVQLHLPVRLRWLWPLGSRVEVTESLDASCQGLLFHSAESCAVNSHVWVTFPFDPHAATAQPEIPARVVRVKTTTTGAHLVGVEFELPPRRAVVAVENERRASNRIQIAVPVHLRPADAPWPEEAMTVDVSDGGARFLSTRFYGPGDLLRVTLPYGRWTSRGEIAGRTLRVEPIPGSLENHVAVAFAPPAKS